MVGTIRFPYRNHWAEATLREDGCWVCPAIPCLTRLLDFRFGPAWQEVPTVSPEGLRLFYGAARLLKGTVIVEPTMQ